MSRDEEEFKLPIAHLVFLHTAAEAATSDLEKAVKNEADWQSIVDARGKSALFYAAQTDNVKNCQYLVKKGASWWAVDHRGDTPMHWAAHGGAAKVIKHLLSDASLAYDHMGRRMFLVKDKDGVTAMHIAAKRSSAKILKMFVDAANNGDDIHKLACDQKLRSPLHYAATYASIECVQLILDEDKFGLPVDQKDIYGLTPLMIAAGENYPQSVEIIRLLYARKPSSISAQNKNGQTALHLAVAANNLRTIDTLLELMPQIVENCDSEFRTPLHYAADSGHCEAVERLLKAGSRNTMKDHFQVTPAHYAAQHSKKALQSLLNHAREVKNSTLSRPPTRNDEEELVQDIADKDKRTCLMWAVAAGNLESIQYLLSNSRPDRTDQDAYGYNALHLAVHMNDEAACRELIRQGWNQNERTKFDMTALHLAAGRANTPDIIQTLVTMGASPTEKDQMSRTPIFMACFGGKAHNLHVMIRELGFAWKVENLNKTQIPLRDCYNRTLLHAAAFAGYSACISTMFLIEDEDGMPLINPLVHWKSIEGETALHVACAEGKTDCVLTLLSIKLEAPRRADKNALSGNVFPNLYGPLMKTPLQRAIEEKAKRPEKKNSYDAIISFLEHNGGRRNAHLVRWDAVVRIQRNFRCCEQYREWRFPMNGPPRQGLPTPWHFDYDVFRGELCRLRPEKPAVQTKKL